MRVDAFIALATLVAVQCAFAAAGGATGSVTRFGVYEMAGPPEGPWKVVSVVPASEIHAKLGLRFGVDFEICGIPEASAVLVASMTHPAMVKPDGTSATHDVAQMGPFPVSDGCIKSSYGFTFDHPYEMVPGVWRIGIAYRGRVVAEKSFDVVAPE